MMLDHSAILAGTVSLVGGLLPATKGALSPILCIPRAGAALWGWQRSAPHDVACTSFQG